MLLFNPAQHQPTAPLGGCRWHTEQVCGRPRHGSICLLIWKLHACSAFFKLGSPLAAGIASSPLLLHSYSTLSNFSSKWSHQLAPLQCETWELSLILPLFSDPAPHWLVWRWLACDACQPRPLSLAKVSSRFPRFVWRLTVSSFQALAWRHSPGTRPGPSAPAWLRSAAPPCLVFGRFPVLAQVLLPWDSSLQFW